MKIPKIPKTQKTRILGILIILGFGAAKFPFEQRLTQEHRAAYFHSSDLNIDLRQQLGQMGFLAALSGFRAPVADVMWIQNYMAWERVEWGRMKLLMDTVVALQPRCEMFWDVSAWHMAYNASAAAIDDRKQPLEMLRLKAQMEYFKLGEDYYLRGIQNNPDRPMLYERLGSFYRDKYHDHAKAAAAFEKAAAFPNQLPYLKRAVAFEMAQVPEYYQQAYKRLVSCYHLGEEERVPSLLKWLAVLEEKLNVPSEQRIGIPESPHP
jgi:hypothetical protein